MIRGVDVLSRIQQYRLPGYSTNTHSYMNSEKLEFLAFHSISWLHFKNVISKSQLIIYSEKI